MKVFLSISAIAIGLVASGVYADEDDKKQSRLEKLSQERTDRLNKKYAATGETRRCLSTRQIRDSQILDDETILFKGIGNRAYVNKLKRKCHRLMYEERFAYRSHSGQLCRNEIITVLDGFGQSWASCSLGDFQEYKRKPKEETEDSR